MCFLNHDIRMRDMLQDLNCKHAIEMPLSKWQCQGIAYNIGLAWNRPNVETQV
jgi:hypothetical protein